MSQDDYYERLLKRHGLGHRIPTQSTKREPGQKTNNQKYDELMRLNGLEPPRPNLTKWDEPKVMNKGLQEYNLKKKLRREHEDPDQYDLRDLIDPRHHYNENVKELRKQHVGKPLEDDPEYLNELQEEHHIEVECKQKGLQIEEVIKQRKAARDAEDAENKAKAKEKEAADIRILFSNIKNLYSENIYKNFKGEDKLTPIRVSHVYNVPVVKKFIKIMGDQEHFKQVDYASYCIVKYGLYYLKLRFFNLYKYYITIEELGSCFNYPGIRYKPEFNIRNCMLSGSTEDEIIFFVTKNQKSEIKSFCEQVKKYTGSKVYESDIVNLCIAYAMHSMFKGDIIVAGYENATIYSEGELVRSIENYMETYNIKIRDHFQNIREKLLEEYEYKTYIPHVSRVNLELKDSALDLLDDLCVPSLLNF